MMPFWKPCTFVALCLPLMLPQLVSARHGNSGKGGEKVNPPHQDITEKISSDKVKNGGRNGPMSGANNMPFPFWLPVPMIPWDDPWGQPVDKGSKKQGNTNRAQQDKARDKETEVHGEKNSSGLGKQQGNLSSHVQSGTHSRMKSRRKDKKGDRTKRDTDSKLSQEEENIKDQWLTTNLDSLWIPGFENVHLLRSEEQTNDDLYEHINGWADHEKKFRRDVDQIGDVAETAFTNRDNAKDVPESEAGAAKSEDASDRTLTEYASWMQKPDSDRELEINTRDVAEEPESYEAALRKLHDIKKASSVLTAIEKNIGIDPETLVDTTHQRVNSLQSDLKMYSNSIRDHIEHVHQTESSKKPPASKADVGALKRQLHHEQEMVDLIQTELKQLRDIELMATGLEVAKYVAQVHAEHYVQEAASRRHIAAPENPSQLQSYAQASPVSYQLISPTILQENLQSFPAFPQVYSRYPMPHGPSVQSWVVPSVASPAVVALEETQRHEKAEQRHNPAMTLSTTPDRTVSFFTSSRIPHANSNPLTQSKHNSDSHFDQEQDHLGTTYFPGTTYSPPPSWLKGQQSNARPDASYNPLIYQASQSNTKPLQTVSTLYPLQAPFAFTTTNHIIHPPESQSMDDILGDSASGGSPLTRETSYHPPLTPAREQQDQRTLGAIWPTYPRYFSTPLQNPPPIGAALPANMLQKNQRPSTLVPNYFFPKAPYPANTYQSYYLPNNMPMVSSNTAASMFASRANSALETWQGLPSVPVEKTVQVVHPAVAQPAFLYLSPAGSTQSFASPQLRPSQIGEVIKTGTEDQKVLMNKKPITVQAPDMSGTIPGWFGLYPKYPEDITDQMRRVDNEANKTRNKEAKREYKKYEAAERNLEDAERASEVVTNIEKNVGFDPGSIAKLVDFVKTAAVKDVAVSKETVAKDQETVERIKEERAQTRTVANVTNVALLSAEQKLNLDETTLRDAQERLEKIKQMEMIVTEIEAAKFYAQTRAKQEVRSAKRTLDETLRRQAIGRVH